MKNVISPTLSMTKIPNPINIGSLLPDPFWTMYVQNRKLQDQKEEQDVLDAEEVYRVMEDKTNVFMVSSKSLHPKRRGRTCGKWKARETLRCDDAVDFQKKTLYRLKVRREKERHQMRRQKSTL